MALPAELRLRAGPWSAVLLPDAGAALGSLDHGGVPVLAPLPPGADPNNTPAGAFWMIPWANRMDGGALGPGWRMPVNRPDENTAIHGLSRDRPWAVLRAAEDHARLVQTVSAPPYEYRAMLSVRLAVDGLRLGLTVTNCGPEAAPVGFGWHPWFARRAGQRVGFAASHRLVTDARMLPIAARPEAGSDAEVSGLAGWDAHYAGWDGRASLEDAALRITLRAGGAWARNLQLYVPPGGAAICLEPTSHVPDAPNRPTLAPLGPLHLLPPGATRRAWLRVAAGH